MLSAPREHAAEHGQRLGGAIGRARAVFVQPDAVLDEGGDAQALRERGWGDQAGVGHEVVLVEGHSDRGQIV